VLRTAPYNRPALCPRAPSLLSSTLPVGRWPCLQLASLNTHPAFRPKSLFPAKLPFAEYEVPQVSIPVSDQPPASTWELDEHGRPQLNYTRLTEASDDDLTSDLEWTARNQASMHITRALWHYMRKKRHIRPVVVHYESLILANCDPSHGSISGVKALLKKMALAGIVVGGTIDAAVLQVGSLVQR
jgi:hypothetical protein